MKATVTEPKTWQRVIEVEIPAADVDAKYDEKLKKYKKEIKLPGFRPGKVPVKILNSRFGESIREESVDELMNSAYQDALKENKIVPVAEAKITDVKADDKEQPISFKLEVEVDPEIEIKDYKNLKIKLETKKVTDKDIDKAVEDIRERMAEFKAVERKSKKGDILTLEYSETSVDGEKKENFSPAPQKIELGTCVLKEFDKELVGLGVDDAKEVAVKFPKDYRDSEIAGKSGEVKIVVKAVEEKVIPEMNEEFFKKLGDFKDLDALKVRIREDMEAGNLQSAKTVAYEKAIDKIIEKNDFEVPPARLEYYLEKIAEDESKYYPDGQKPDMEDVKKRHTETGIKALKQYRIIDYIAKAEKIKAKQSAVDEKIKAIAEQYHQPFEEIKKVFRQNGTVIKIREEVKEEMTLDALIGEIPWPSDEKKDKK